MTIPPAVAVPYGDDTTWSKPLDSNLLVAYVDACRSTAANTTEKGDRLQHLLSWLLAHVPGFQIRQINHFSDDRAQEIDILLWNERRSEGSPSFSERIIAECKNWERPVDSSDVAWFDWKMRLGGVREGILLAANGVTGDHNRRTAAQGILSIANAEQRKILVLTLDELETLRSREDLRNLLVDKTLDLTARDALP